MAGKVAELRSTFNGVSDHIAQDIAHLWSQWVGLRDPKVNEWKELRNYLFATDTTTTTNQTLPWKNSTTTPKLTQIRDNLHSNYISSLFPNDNWLEWRGYSLEDEVKEKKEAITAYMANKTRENNFRNVVSQLLYDYIDYGNAFYDVHYEDNGFINEEGEYVQGYVGPVAKRISPYDVVFNPAAVSYEKSPKIIRKIITIGELKQLAEADEDWAVAATKTEVMRKAAGAFTVDDFHKAVGYELDGFGSLQQYYGSEYVEVLTFEGDYYDTVNQDLHSDMEVVVIDRSITVKKGKIDNWLGKSLKGHVGWRLRPDNLYAMGPLDNLVGMQYRIDHLENLKADAQDLLVHPPLVIKGDVDPFDWGPNAEIYITGDGDVSELGQGLQGVISAQNEIQRLMELMEEMAGAPKQAMGVRTPGEKTAFEVQSLENAAGRIFQEKVINFEVNLLEPMLNAMLAEARRNIDGVDLARVMDDDLGVETFIEVTKDDITAAGKLRPIGARHFAQQAQLLQNLNQAFAGPMGEMIKPHFSSKELAKLVEDSLQIGQLGIVRPNVGVFESVETQKMAVAAQEEAEVSASAPVPGV